MPTPSPWPTPAAGDIRLIVSDMDGTLLDENSHIPAGFDRILSVMEDRDIVFAPASGRQLATLTDLFPTGAGAFIAENGAVVTHAGTLVSTRPPTCGATSCGARGRCRSLRVPASCSVG